MEGPPVTLARHAMATRFELVLHGNDPSALRAAGEEALDEIDRLEAQQSLYRPSSEIARVNALAAKEKVQVSPSLFALLESCLKLHHETEGAFDVTVAPLVKCWGFMGESGRMPRHEEIAAAREKVGMHLVELCSHGSTVRFSRPGVMLDLGAIGKGYAIERAAEILREAGVTSALLHGGTSTAYGIGCPPDAPAWTIAVHNPKPNSGAEPLTTFELNDEALSVSAVWGKSFQHEGKLLGHVLDPRTGYPASSAILAAVVVSSATESDALSTALLTVGRMGQKRISGLRPRIRTLVAVENQRRIETSEM
ncbi:MAG TPA: FAD:protein FMN transferase [Candidatus Dormibacteraeota bacterium]|nr:FAD:protein FMN transferase [Candidatus Dormibacteraeota bacterium]